MLSKFPRTLSIANHSLFAGDAEEAEGNMADDDDDGEGRLGSTLQFVVCFGSEFPVSDS